MTPDPLDLRAVRERATRDGQTLDEEMHAIGDRAWMDAGDGFGAQSQQAAGFDAEKRYLAARLNESRADVRQALSVLAATRKALRPFASFACDPAFLCEPTCYNCQAVAALALAVDPKEGT